MSEFKWWVIEQYGAEPLDQQHFGTAGAANMFWNFVLILNVTMLNFLLAHN